MKKYLKFLRKVNQVKGFTLVELLVVIAILGILAAAVLVAVDPTEQIARGADSGRKTTISQIGNALQSYYTVQAAYPTVDTSWLTSLKNAGELKSVPPTESSAATCASPGAKEAGYCIKVSGAEAVVYVVATSKTEKVRAGSGTACTNTTYVVWSSSDGGKTGVYCSATEPAVASLGSALK